jgi:hypothetical protein
MATEHSGRWRLYCFMYRSDPYVVACALLAMTGRSKCAQMSHAQDREELSHAAYLYSINVEEVQT